MNPSPVVEGDGAPTVVFVHGTGDRGRSFAAVANELRHEHRTIRYDRHGYGDSRFPDQTLVDFGTHIEHLLAIIGEEPVVIAAHSHGGLIALGAAVRRPDLVRSLLLYETAISWLPDWPRNRMDDALYSAEPVEAAMRVLFGDRLDAMDDTEKAVRRRDFEVLVAELLSVRRTGAPIDLRSVRCPILYGLSIGESFRQAPPHLIAMGCAVEVAETGVDGHRLHHDDPAAFAGLVRRAVARQAGSHAS